MPRAADGAGAMLAAVVSVLLVGRRLGAPILGSAVLLSGALAVLAAGLGLLGLAVGAAAVALAARRKARRVRIGTRRSERRAI